MKRLIKADSYSDKLIDNLLNYPYTDEDLKHNIELFIDVYKMDLRQANLDVERFKNNLKNLAKPVIDDAKEYLNCKNDENGYNFVAIQAILKKFIRVFEMYNIIDKGE